MVDLFLVLTLSLKPLSSLMVLSLTFPSATGLELLALACCFSPTLSALDLAEPLRFSLVLPALVSLASWEMLVGGVLLVLFSLSEFQCVSVIYVMLSFPFIKDPITLEKKRFGSVT